MESEWIEVKLTGVRSDGFLLTETSKVFGKDLITGMESLSKKKRFMELLTNVFDYGKYGKKAGKIPEIIDEDSEEYQLYKLTRNAERTISKMKSFGVSIPEDVKDFPVPKFKECHLTFVKTEEEKDDRYPFFSCVNGKRIL